MSDTKAFFKDKKVLVTGAGKGKKKPNQINQKAVRMEISYFKNRTTVLKQENIFQGIGRALAKRLCQLGSNVVAVSRTQSDLDSLTREIGSGLSTVCVDLQDWNATREKLKDCVQGVHCLVNNAAIAQLEPFMQISEQHFDQ
jgi:hypothetical protein